MVDTLRNIMRWLVPLGIAYGAVLALISLGYKQLDAHKAIRKVVEEKGGAGILPSDELVRHALKL